MVTPANYTYGGIRQYVRDYVGISSSSLLPDSVIDQEANYFYTANIPESIKLDQLRTVYEVFTIPYVDRYPVNTNQYQSFRSPCQVDGLYATYYKDRKEFYGWWPNVPTYVQPTSGDGTSTLFQFTIGQTPIVRTTFMCSVPNTSGYQLICADDGGGQNPTGNLLLVTRNSTGDYTPPFPAVSPLPPNPLPNPPYNNIVGSINYITGAVTINWPTAPASGELLRCNFFQGSIGRPCAVLYWNNEIVVRPIPKYSHRIELEAYYTPAQFLNSSDSPVLNNWKVYIALGVSLNLLTRMGDMARVAQLMPAFEDAEGRVLERQANEEIGQANATIFNQQGPYYGQYPYGGYYY